MIIIKGGHRRRGAGGYIHVGSLRRREARASGRADQDGGGGAPRADPAAEQPLAPRRNSAEISLTSGRRAPGQTETLRWRFASDALALRKRSPSVESLRGATLRVASDKAVGCA